MPENYFKKLIKQTSVYSSSGIIIAAAGFLTFPILTRVFSTAEYGHMSLANSLLAIIIVFSKFGIQHSVLRFFSEFKEQKRKLDISYYYTTSVVGVLVISLAMALLFLLVVEFFFASGLESQYLMILRIISILIVFDGLSSILLMFLNAEQNVKFHSLVRIVRRYVEVGITIPIVAIFKLGVVGFFWGSALVGGLFSLFLIIYYFRRGQIKLWHISVPLFKESLSYGLPLIGNELCDILLALGARFLIQYYLGASAVGIYSASYNLTSYFIEFFANPFRLAVMPLFMAIWEKKGKSETAAFLSSSMRFYFLIGIPIIFGVSFLGKEIISLLASEKYIEGAAIMPYVISGFVLYKANFLYGAGLYLKKSTTTLFVVNFSAASINIILNVILIPLWGILGSAIATLVAYLFYVVTILWVSSGTIRYKIPFEAIIKYSAISLMMVLAMLSIRHLGAAQLFVRIAVGIIIYAAGVLIFDVQIRMQAMNILHVLSGRKSAAVNGRIEANSSRTDLPA
jgi:O-antigen/teichoic acid export membrane protein